MTDKPYFQRPGGNSWKDPILKDRLFGVIKWPRKGEGTWYSSNELAKELESRGHGHFPAPALGAFLTADGYIKKRRWVDRDSVKNDPDAEYTTKPINTWKVAFVIAKPDASLTLPIPETARDST